MAPPALRPAPPRAMVRFILIPPLGDRREFLEAGPTRRDRKYDWLKITIGKLFDEPFEHVTVLYQGRRRDLFVGETSAINGRHIRNIRATEIYRANTLTQHPGLDPENLPAISGPAVLFPDEIVWR